MVLSTDSGFQIPDIPAPTPYTHRNVKFSWCGQGLVSCVLGGWILNSAKVGIISRTDVPVCFFVEADISIRPSKANNQTEILLSFTWLNPAFSDCHHSFSLTWLRLGAWHTKLMFTLFTEQFNRHQDPGTQRGLCCFAISFQFPRGSSATCMTEFRDFGLSKLQTLWRPVHSSW